MNRIICFLAIGMVWSLILLPAKPVLAATVDHCSSGDLPWTGSISTRIADTLSPGEVIPGSDAMRTINISCSTAASTSCRGDTGWALSVTSGAVPSLIPGTNNVYTFVGLPTGVGYQFVDQSGQALPLDANNRHETGVPIQIGDQSVPLHFRMVKTADDLEAGNFDIHMLMSCFSGEWANTNQAGSELNLTFNLDIVTQTCKMPTSDVPVSLPSVSRSAFSGPGSVAGSTLFNLEFDCDASAKAHFNISDITDFSNITDTLNLQPGSTASNVGVRLRHDGNPVMLSPRGMPGVIGDDFPLNNLESTPSRISLPFSAEYVQTGASVVPGSVKAQAAITIDYL